jgi:hypothetical protein
LRKVEKKRAKRKAACKKNTNNNHTGKSVIYVMHRVINQYFPDLTERMSGIEDYRNKSKYSMAELITACIAMFIFKEGSRNAFNNDRDEANFQKNFKDFQNTFASHGYR